MGVWEVVAIDSLKFHLGPPCPTLLRPAGWSPLKRPYGRFRGGPLTGSLLFLWTPQTVRLCYDVKKMRVRRKHDLITMSRWRNCNANAKQFAMAL
jgi:hypothetical protein